MAGQHFARQLRQTQIAQRVAQQASHQEFHREIVEPFGVRVVVTSFGLQHVVHELVADGQRDRHQQFRRVQIVFVTNKRVADMAENRFPKNFSRPDWFKRLGNDIFLRWPAFRPDYSTNSGYNGFLQDTISVAPQAIKSILASVLHHVT